ncbi:MAG: hypothetical protein U1F53_18510 [Burkholderiaceae bacterium]
MNRTRSLMTRPLLGAALLASALLAQAQAPADTAASAAPAAKATVPKLAITWQCKDCTVNDKVPPLIEEAYAAAASKGGLAVSDSDVAEVTITDFRQRPPGARVMLGIFAGKDRLAVHINYRGKEANADDYAVNAMQGMNHLCESVGRKSYDQIAAMLKAAQP